MDLVTEDSYEAQIEKLRKRVTFLYETEKFKLAIDEADKLLGYSQDDFTALLIISICNFKIGNVSASEDFALRLLERYPESPDAHRVYAMILNNSKRPELGKEHSERAVELNPSDGNNYYTLADSLRKLKDKSIRPQIVEAIKKAISLEPEKAYYHIFLAELYILDFKYEWAEKEFEISLQLDTQAADAYIDYAVLKIELGQLEQAEEYTVQALTLEPNNLVAQRNLRQIHSYKRWPKVYYRYLRRRLSQQKRSILKESRIFSSFLRLLIEQKQFKYALKVLIKYQKLNRHNIKENMGYAYMLYKAGALPQALYSLKDTKMYNSKEKCDELDNAINSVSKEMYAKGIQSIIRIHPTILTVGLILTLVIAIVFRNEDPRLIKGVVGLLTVIVVLGYTFFMSVSYNRKKQ